jgi:hypothetical protein
MTSNTPETSRSYTQFLVDKAETTRYVRGTSAITRAALRAFLAHDLSQEEMGEVLDAVHARQARGRVERAALAHAERVNMPESISSVTTDDLLQPDDDGWHPSKILETMPQANDEPDWRERQFKD